MEVGLKVEGLDEVEKQLLKLGAEMGEKTLLGALMNAALPTFKRAKNAAPGSISKAVSRVKHRSTKTRKIAIKGISANGKSAAGVSVIVRKKKAPHAHLVEHGTKQRQTKGKGNKKPYRNANRGRMKAQHFMQEAWESEGGQNAVDRFSKNIRQRIKRLTKK